MNSLSFSGTREHALLVQVIREAETSPSVGYFGRTALQKVMYFLKVLGTPMQYNFEIHHYGPFCDQVSNDVDLLTADGVVTDQARTTSSRYWNFIINPNGPSNELLTRHAGFVKQYQELVNKVVYVFGGLDPRHLELYSTLHYAYRYESAGKKTVSQEAIVARFTEYKDDKFPLDEVHAALRVLADAGLIRIAK